MEAARSNLSCLTELHFGGFGSSLACSCGNKFWITSDEEGTEELLVYEGFDYLQEESVFDIRDLGDQRSLLMLGCTSHRLNSYAGEIMYEENLKKSEFLMLRRDSLKMSRAAGLEFKNYVVFYKVNEVDKLVIIYAIVDGRREYRILI